MATRADLFRWAAERSGPKRRKKARRHRRHRTVEAAAETATPGLNLTPYRMEALHAGRKATYALEDSASGPSRRSSRKASNRQRTDVKMIQKRRISLSRPRRLPGDAPPR